MSGLRYEAPSSGSSGSGIFPWATATAYKTGQPVTQGGNTYLAVDNHTSGATFAGDSAHWTALPIPAANQSAAALGWIDLVADFGADPTGATGGQGAILQAAINQIQATAGTGPATGTIYMPAGTYLFDDAQQTGGSGGPTGGAYSGQVLFPARDVNADGALTIRIVGDSPSPQILATHTPGWTEPVEVGGTIIRSTATSGNICDVIPVNVSGFGYMSNVRVMFEKLTVRANNNPQCGGLKLYYAAAGRVTDCTLGINAGSNGATQPTGSGRAVWLPPTNNSDDIQVRGCSFHGWPIGLSHGEHTSLDHLHFGECMVAIECQGCFHLSVGRHLIIEECPIGIQAVGNCYIDYQCAFEGYTAWGIPPLDVDDQYNGFLHGRLAFVKFGPGGRTPSLTTRGAAYLSITSIADATYVDSQRPAATADSFQRPNNSAWLGQMDSGQVYDYWNQTWGVVSNKAYLPSGGAGVCYAVVGKFHPTFDTADHTVQADVTMGTGTNQKVGVCARYGYPNTALVAYLEKGAANQVVLAALPAGTILATSAAVTVANSTTYTLAMKVTNNTVTVSVNGIVYITYTLTSGNQTTYNANTKCGLFAIDVDNTPRWAAFQVASETLPETVQAAPSVLNALKRRGFQNLWKLDETTGSPLDSILGKTASIQGAVVQGASGVIKPTAYSFPGAGTAYVLVNSAKVVGGMSTFSVVAWIKTSAQGTIYAERAASGNDIVKLDVDSSGHLRLTYRDDAGNLVQINTTALVTDGNWHMVTAVKNGGTYAAYIDDGTASGGSASVINNTPTTNFTDSGLESRIAVDKGDTTTPFNGSIAYVGLAPSALSAWAVKTLYYNGLANSLGG